MQIWHKVPQQNASNPLVGGEDVLQKSYLDPDLCRNTMKYINTHKRRDAVEIRLHFINNKSLKYAYRHNGSKLARVLEAYL
jgi:hypothetical protein